MDDAELVWCDATELARLVATGVVSAVEVVHAHLIASTPSVTE